MLIYFSKLLMKWLTATTVHRKTTAKTILKQKQTGAKVGYGEMSLCTYIRHTINIIIIV